VAGAPFQVGVLTRPPRGSAAPLPGGPHPGPFPASHSIPLFLAWLMSAPLHHVGIPDSSAHIPKSHSLLSPQQQSGQCGWGLPFASHPQPFGSCQPVLRRWPQPFRRFPRRVPLSSAGDSLLTCHTI
jgi:hypothetical protein